MAGVDRPRMKEDIRRVIEDEEEDEEVDDDNHQTIFDFVLHSFIVAGSTTNKHSLTYPPSSHTNTLHPRFFSVTSNSHDCSRGSARRTASGRHSFPRLQYSEDDERQLSHSRAGGMRDHGQRHQHMLRQDWHPDSKQNDGGGGLGGWETSPHQSPRG